MKKNKKQKTMKYYHYKAVHIGNMKRPTQLRFPELFRCV